MGLKLNDTKLVLMLRDKENYDVHYRNQQFYLNQGLKLRKVHRVLECDQSVGWSRMNTEFRKRAKNEFKGLMIYGVWVNKISLSPLVSKR